MLCRQLLLLAIVTGAFVSASALARGQELSAAEKTLSTEIERCPAQNADRCRAAALQQFDTSLRREFPTLGGVYWTKALGALKRHSAQLDADIRAAGKSAPTGATGNAASAGNKMEACRAAGGTFAECYYWIVVLGGGRK